MLVHQNKPAKSVIFGTLSLVISSAVIAKENKDNNVTLEQVTVISQKLEQSLQDASNAISVLGNQQLEFQGISGFDDLGRGAIPYLRVKPLGNSPSNLVVVMRGNGPFDASEITREASVAVYQDGVYLGRSQGLGLEFTDPERLEVLRGPQGTLFGRNAIGGAVNVISKKPSGQLGFEQTLGIGSYNEFRSATHISLPNYKGLKTKLDYLQTERDGWVNNTAPGEEDYNAYDKEGVKFTLNWALNDRITMDYSFDRSDVDSAQIYYQFYQDNIGVFGEERKRLSNTRMPVVPLDPTSSVHSGHSVNLTWVHSDSLTIKSVSAYRKLKENANNNYAGVLYFNGLNDASWMEQKQYSQELQLVGTHENIDWIAGLYYLNEDGDKTLQDSFTLDIFGDFGEPLSPIIPATTFDALGSGANLPPNIVHNQTKSQALYSQFTWSPEALEDKLLITVGGRYTDDERDATRILNGTQKSKQDISHMDYLITVDYHWTEHISTYVKWTTGYKAGGVNTRSTSFTPFVEEEAKSLELGLKSEFWNRRLRLNTALFTTDYEDMQLDFVDDDIVNITETINAQETVKVSGLEFDLHVIPVEGLLLGISYSYLDDDMPLQPNPLADGELQGFHLPLTPRHAGALTADYQFSAWDIGTLTVHVDLTSTDHYAHTPTGKQRTDAYTLLNARLTLADIKLRSSKGAFKVSLWGQNLTDEEYIVSAFPVGDPIVSVGQAFGTPRTTGVDVTYQF